MNTFIDIVIVFLFMPLALMLLSPLFILVLSFMEIALEKRHVDSDSHSEDE